MNVRTTRLFLTWTQQIIHINKINVSVNRRFPYQYQTIIMQKSLLSFFKPLSDKSQINRDINSKENEKQESNSVEHSSPEKSTLNLEDSPVAQKKRKRIIALESDSDGENAEEQPPAKKVLSVTEKLRTYERKSKIPKKTTSLNENSVFDKTNNEDLNDASKESFIKEKTPEPEEDPENASRKVHNNQEPKTPSEVKIGSLSALSKASGKKKSNKSTKNKKSPSSKTAIKKECDVDPKDISEGSTTEEKFSKSEISNNENSKTPSKTKVNSLSTSSKASAKKKTNKSSKNKDSPSNKTAIKNEPKESDADSKQTSKESTIKEKSSKSGEEEDDNNENSKTPNKIKVGSLSTLGKASAKKKTNKSTKNKDSPSSKTAVKNEPKESDADSKQTSKESIIKEKSFKSGEEEDDNNETSKTPNKIKAGSLSTLGKASAKKKTKTPNKKENSPSSKTVIKNEPKESNTASTKTKSPSSKNNEALSKTDSKEVEEVTWKYGQKTPYLLLAKTLQKVEEISARLKIIDLLSDYFRNVIMSNKADLLPSIYLCLNTLGPAYEGLELGIADTYLMKAIAQCTGRTLAQIKADTAKIGDLGIVAEQSRSNQKIMFRPAALTIQGVFSQLSDIATISGKDSIKKKIDKIQALFVACKDCEARFIIRSLAGKLRIGLAEQSVVQALALACTITPPNRTYPSDITDISKTMSPSEFKKIVEENLLILKTTYCECPNFNLIVPVLLEHGIEELPKHCKITPGIPVKPMLAQPTKGVHEVFQRFEDIKFTCEWKYDGERAQIHVLEDGSIKIYSRNQEDNTSKYPDIIEDIRQSFKCNLKSGIIDAEAVAWDREQKKIMPFQVLSTRKRKDADVNEIKVRICVFLFDLLYLNGESLTQKPLVERRNLLKEYLQEVEEKFSFVSSIDTDSMEEVHEYLEESVKGNCEGLMVKTLETEATYEIAKRSRNWLKLKKDYLDGCGDTLDLVVIGGYIGKGKRTGQYGGFLLASYDADNDEYQTICKIGTGFTEEALASHSEFLKQHLIPKAKPYYRYDSSHEPDHWFDAVQVWEIKCADLSLSPIYYSAIGLVESDRGISLRFPRFLRIREDKTVEQATSSQQVAELYQNQDQIKNNATTNESKFNEEDF